MVDKTLMNQSDNDGSSSGLDNATSSATAMNSTSTSGVYESLSAIMDGEASDLELRRVLKESDANAELLAVWGRYHQVRDNLHHDTHPDPAVNLLAGIRERIVAENIQQASQPWSRKLGMLGSRLGQYAVAASVAFTVLFSANYLQVAGQSDVNGQSSQIASDSNDLIEFGGDFSPSRLSRTVSMDAEARNRIERAVYKFSENQQPEFGTAYQFPEIEEDSAENTEVLNP